MFKGIQEIYVVLGQAGKRTVGQGRNISCDPSKFDSTQKA